jgi:hypothetical protein
MRLREIVQGIVAIGLLIGLLSIVLESASASAALVMKTTGTGTYKCSSVTGTITFDPPLTVDGGSANETVTSTDTGSGCSGGTPSVLTTHSAGTFSLSSNSCQVLETSSQSVTSTVTFSNGAKSSSFRGSSMIASVSPTTLSIKGKITGSYPSADAKSDLVIKESESKIIHECESTKGLDSLTVVSGASKKQ